MSSLTLGIDISKDKFDVALLAAEQYQLGTFDNSKKGYRSLAKWLKKRQAQSAHVCIEASGRYGDGVATFLHEAGYAVSVVNPARITAYGESRLKRIKTDPEDAKDIAHFCATQKPRLWTPPPPELQELQALTRRLDSLKEDRTRELNRKKSGISSEAVLQNIEEHIAFLDEQIAALEQQIDGLIKGHPDLRQKHGLLTTIKGVGDITAAKFLAEVPDISHFGSAPELAAYAGLTPKVHRSGSSVHRRAHLSKAGNIHLRTAFFMPALSAMRFNPIVRALAERLEDRGKERMMIVAAAMRKLVHLAYGVLKTGVPFDPNYLVNVQETA
jgi:transposase